MTLTTTLDSSRVARAFPRPHVPSGLHGHSLDTHLAAVLLIEAFGTFVLVLTITGTATAATLAKPIAGDPYGSLTVAIAGGVALAVLVGALGPLSGAHLNPAVTIGLAATRRFPMSRVPVYVAGQLAGALGAARVVWWSYGPSARTVAHLAATAPARGIGIWQALAAEALVTFLLMLVILRSTRAGGPSHDAPFAIGAALATAILVSGPITGAGVNPARALGPMIVAGTYTDWWVYLLAPVVGAVAAACCDGSRWLS
jgi:MIP family channel proteins